MGHSNKTFIFLPPMARISGGLAVLMQIAEHLHRSGFEARVVLREPRRPVLPEGFCVPAVEWSRCTVAENDLWLVPEGWVNALAPGLMAGARCVVYVQNWAYLFSSLPQGVTWRDLDVSFLAVSRPVAWFVEQTLGRASPVVRPGIDRGLFHPVQDPPRGPLRVAFMPRKNKALAELIQAIFTARNPDLADPTRLIWSPIQGQSPGGVAELLRQSHIFLATGFPEGCPLPPLEAMACGCLPVGFAGFGGWEYMRSIDRDAGRPWWPVPDNPWLGNGYWVPDADALAAALALERAVRLWTDAGPELAQALQAGQQTADAFDLREQHGQVLAAWSKISGS